MIYCILSSYNRPMGLKRAISSIINQTYKKWTCYIMDDGSDFDVESLCTDRRINLFQAHPSAEERVVDPGYIAGINQALDLIAKRKNGIIVYLCDDDWFYPTWFQALSNYFDEHKDHFVVYGKEMNIENYAQVGDPSVSKPIRFPTFQIAQKPGGRVDHVQVAHRSECIQDGQRWPCVFPGDLQFFEQLVKKYPFYPLDTLAVQKAYHSKGLNVIESTKKQRAVVWENRFETGLTGWRE